MPKPSRSESQGRDAGYRISHTAPDESSGRPLHHHEGGSPVGLVRIYRAAPPGTESIGRGDWISLNPGYARRHSRDRRDPGRDMLVLTAEVPQRDVYWDENDPDEHGYQGPAIRHPDVLEEDGRIIAWEDYHDEHPHGLEGWLGSSVSLPGPVHDQVHDEFGSEDDRADALMDVACEQGALRGAIWADDRYSAREFAEAHAAVHLRGLPAGSQVTAFTVRRNDDGSIEDIAIHHYQNGAQSSSRRYHLIDLDGWRYRHPALERGAGRENGSRPGS